MEQNGKSSKRRYAAYVRRKAGAKAVLVFTKDRTLDRIDTNNGIAEARRKAGARELLRLFKKAGQKRAAP